MSYRAIFVVVLYIRGLSLGGLSNFSGYLSHRCPGEQNTRESGTAAERSRRRFIGNSIFAARIIIAPVYEFPRLTRNGPFS